EACPDGREFLRVLAPLVEHRSGRVIRLPRLDPPRFLAWLHEHFDGRALPPYLLICDSFENFPLEFQFLCNAFAVTGRLWFDDPRDCAAYVRKVLAVEHGTFTVGREQVLASPMDDDVTYADYAHIIAPMLPALAEAGFSLRSLLGDDCHRQALLDAG